MSLRLGIILTALFSPCIAVAIPGEKVTAGKLLLGAKVTAELSPEAEPSSPKVEGEFEALIDVDNTAFFPHQKPARSDATCFVMRHNSGGFEVLLGDELVAIRGAREQPTAANTNDCRDFRRLVANYESDEGGFLSGRKWLGAQLSRAYANLRAEKHPSNGLGYGANRASEHAFEDLRKESERAINDANWTRLGGTAKGNMNGGLLVFDGLVHKKVLAEHWSGHEFEAMHEVHASASKNNKTNLFLQPEFVYQKRLPSADVFYVVVSMERFSHARNLWQRVVDQMNNCPELRDQNGEANNPTQFREATKHNLTILAKLLAAVAEIHAAGWAHRDLKLDNVMVREDETGTVDVKIIDFGLARRLGTLPTPDD
jgi:hypothetical protein